MKFDVVVVNYRSGSRLAECLQAARAFLGDRSELIVVDNSPGDETVAAVAAQQRATMLESPGNIGFAAAVNRGVAAGAAKLVLLLNPDVREIHGDPGAVEAAFEDDRVAAVGVRLLNSDGSIQLTARRQPRLVDLFAGGLGLGSTFPGWRRHYYLDEWDYGSSRVVESVFGACLFLRRSAIEDVGPFDERFFLYAEETDWLVRASRRGWRTLFLAEVEAVHAQRQSSDAGEDILSLLLLESHYRYAAKHLGHVRTALLRIALLGVDTARWVRVASLRRRKRDLRRLLRQRLATHLTGRAPHPP